MQIYSLEQNMKTLKERFERNFTKGKDNECWIWNGPKNAQGYGMIWDKRASHKAHRISYKLYREEIPIGFYVMHICDIPSCVNPFHLFIGTHADNMHDMYVKGRRNHSLCGVKGENHYRAKLTEKEIIEIRTNALTSKEIQRLFNIKQNHVSKIRLGIIWKHTYKPLLNKGGL